MVNLYVNVSSSSSWSTIFFFFLENPDIIILDSPKQSQTVLQL